MKGKPRIVSLQPSSTEIICALGRGDQLVGRSHWCDCPAEAASLPACTGADGLLDVERLRQLEPDLVFAAEGMADLDKAVVGLAGSAPQIIRLSAVRLAAIWTDIKTIAEAVGAEEEGQEYLAGLKNRVVDIIQKTCVLKKRPAVACLEWLDPLMVAGCWIPELVELAGGHDPLGQAGQPARALAWETLTQTDPEFIVLMPCALELERTRQEAAALAKRPGWSKLRAVKSGNVVAVDGRHYFNRPGPGVVDSLELLAEILQPKLFTFGHASRAAARMG